MSRATWHRFLSKSAAPSGWGRYAAVDAPIGTIESLPLYLVPPIPEPPSEMSPPKKDLVSYLKGREALFRSGENGIRTGIKPATRPEYGSFPERDRQGRLIYSDAGKFYTATLPSGRKTTFYLRDGSDASGKPLRPNLSIPSNGWSVDEANDLAAMIFSSGLAGKDGTVADGATFGQTVREIISHDFMRSQPKPHPVMNFLGKTWGSIKDEDEPFRNADIRGYEKRPSSLRRKFIDYLTSKAHNYVYETAKKDENAY